MIEAISPSGDVKPLGTATGSRCPAVAGSGERMAQSNPSGLSVRALNGLPVASIAAPGYLGNLEFSPDSANLLFDFNPGSGRAIGSAPAAGGSLTNLSNVSSPNAYEFGPDASPDGSKISLATNVDGGPGSVLLRDANGANPATVLTASAANQPSPPSWNAAGTRLTFDETDGRVHRVDASGQNPVMLTDASQGPDSEPVYAPVGAKIAMFRMVSDANGGTFAVVVINDDGSSPVTIEPAGESVEAFAWSPDGSKLVVSTDGPDFRFSIWTVNADGSDVQQILADPGRLPTPCLAWAPQSSDQTPPATTIDSLHSYPSVDGFLYPLTTTFHASEPGVAFQCRVDSGAYSDCTSPFWTASGPGSHIFQARGIDAAGNFGTPATVQFEAGSSPAPSTGVPIPISHRHKRCHRHKRRMALKKHCRRGRR